MSTMFREGAQRLVAQAVQVEFEEFLGRYSDFYDFPAEHCIHLRTSNPIESTFATVRHGIGNSIPICARAWAGALVASPETDDMDQSAAHLGQTMKQCMACHATFKVR